MESRIDRMWHESLCAGRFGCCLPGCVFAFAFYREQSLNGLDRVNGAMPTKELERLVLERVRGAEELLQLLARLQRKVTDVLQVGLKRRAVRHGEHAVISLGLAAGVLSPRIPTGLQRSTTRG